MPRLSQPVHRSWDWNSRASGFKVMFLTSTVRDRVTARSQDADFSCWGLGCKRGSDGDDAVVMVGVTQEEEEEAEGDSRQVPSSRPTHRCPS